MFNRVFELLLLLLIFSLSACSDAPKCKSKEVQSAVLEKITNMARSQALFQEVMLESPMVMTSPLGNGFITDDAAQQGAVDDKLILAYARHPKYFFWKAKNDPAMNPLLARADKFMDGLNISLSEVKEAESDGDDGSCTCSGTVTIGQDKMGIKFIAAFDEHKKLAVEVKDNERESGVGPQSAHGSVATLCSTWENIKAATFPPANPQVIAPVKDARAGDKPAIRFGTLIAGDLVANGKVLHNGLRSYKLLQRANGAN